MYRAGDLLLRYDTRDLAPNSTACYQSPRAGSASSHPDGLAKRRKPMPDHVYRIIEGAGSSEKSIEEAI
jgi:hypothetical protein